MAAAEHGNGPNPERTKQCVDRIEGMLRDIDSIIGVAKNECKTKHDAIKDIYQEAKDAWGLSVRALKQVIKVRALERKIEHAREALEEDDAESFDQIRHAIGDLSDLPLGEAALAKAAPDDDDADLRPRHLKQREKDREAEKGNGAEILNGLTAL